MQLRHVVPLLSVLAAVPAAQAQYPSKPIRMIVPYAAGGGTDMIARIVQQRLNQELGQSVVIDNRGGAASIIGTQLAATSPPDGYTIIMVSSAFGINASFYPKLPYDSVKDFSPVIRVAVAPLLLIAHPVLPVKSVKDLIHLAKSKPGQLNYAAAGVGSGSYLSGAMFNSMAGVNITQVPYKGLGPAFADMLSGYTQLMFSPLLPASPHVKSGAVKALAVTSAKRVAELPNVPAISEVLPGYKFDSWSGVLAPARTPQAIVDKLNAAIGRVLSLPETRKALLDQGLQPVGGSPEQFAAHIRENISQIAVVVKQLGLRPEDK